MKRVCLRRKKSCCYTDCITSFRAVALLAIGSGQMCVWWMHSKNLSSTELFWAGRTCFPFLSAHTRAPVICTNLTWQLCLSGKQNVCVCVYAHPQYKKESIIINILCGLLWQSTYIITTPWGSFELNVYSQNIASKSKWTSSMRSNTRPQ